VKIADKIQGSDKVKNVVFDLGGVIMDINSHLTIDAFYDLGLRDIKGQYSQFGQLPFFSAFEKGEITADQFRGEIRQLAGIKLPDHDIDKAWNAMLLDIPGERLQLLEETKKHFPTFLLSNTNEIHYNFFNQYVKDHFQLSGISHLFKTDYYSHTMGMRKPHPEIYLELCKREGLKPAETLFIDDTLPNVEGAAQAGLIAYHLQAPETIINLFENGTH